MNAVSAADREVFCEPNFFAHADCLWEQISNVMRDEDSTRSEILQARDSLQRSRAALLNAEQIFTEELIVAFVDRVRQWVKGHMSANHVSTPQVHLVHRDFRPIVAVDDRPARLHYLYSLRRNGSTTIRLLEQVPAQAFTVSLSRMWKTRLTFNSMFVHPTVRPYALHFSPARQGVVDCPTLLQGYIW